MTSKRVGIPIKLERLNGGEEQLREAALGIIACDDRLKLHLAVVEAAMDLADVFIKFDTSDFDTSDEDFQVVQLLGARTFNAFAASMKLALSGYHQNSALILRDVLETVFLLSYFAGDRSQIMRWRNAEKKERMKYFSPLRVRKALDDRDNVTSMQRAKRYEFFSEFAGHPTINSVWMLRPINGGNSVIGPFMDDATLYATVSEMGLLAVQFGEEIDKFFPSTSTNNLIDRGTFDELKREWLSTFCPTS